ncbi:uncharacterized protein LY89DRAFT_110485 [Mollisia scopiformis]|uniref:Uncharacterized protein n=1 Tax=Mollisia scopiformis TaxID=149040 RepID=A0A194X5J4_MOLSC|nr:uncharacterized protein LY89DRAFT_110485 [Mollisia scopiformis]KUJ15349.1 hypothetical protein LY89DRAFT_110485 [Mollisia scopiformis]
MQENSIDEVDLISFDVDLIDLDPKPKPTEDETAQPTHTAPDTIPAPGQDPALDDEPETTSQPTILSQVNSHLLPFQHAKALGKQLHGKYFEKLLTRYLSLRRQISNTQHDDEIEKLKKGAEELVKELVGTITGLELGGEVGDEGEVGEDGEREGG